MSEFDKFISLVGGAKDYPLLEDLLLGVTTPAERKRISQRIEIINRLLAGEHHHQIAEDLGVGVATVTRGARELSLGRFKALRRKK